MEYTTKTIKWIKNGGEVDFPHNQDESLMYRSLRFNSGTGRYEYLTRKHSAHSHLRGYETVPDMVHYTYTTLSDLIRITNDIHGIDDVVTGDESPHYAPFWVNGGTNA